MAAQCNPLFTDPEFLSAVHERERKDYPDLFYEKDTILYAVVSLENAKIVAGPVSTEKHTKDSEHYLMQHHHISDETGFRLSFCELKVFGSGILMLYHMITGKELTINDLWQKNGIRETDIIEVKGQISSVIFEHQEQELPHNPYDQEVRELDSIRHGDVEMFNRSLAETYRGEVGQLAKNQVRQAKNIAICVIALASRAAISGGMIPEEAFSMVDGYIMKIEDMNNAVKIDSMMRQAEYEFAIRETKTADVISDVSTMKSEVGVLYLSDFNRKALLKLLHSANLEFHHLIDCQAYVYLWKNHPLANEKSISYSQLAKYPCLSFEQGDKSSFYLSEEILSTNEYSRTVKASDRATMLNLMVGLNGYTLCSGIICEELNGSDYLAIPFEGDEQNQNSDMEIGYITRKNSILSKVGNLYVSSLKKYLEQNTSFS